MQDVTAEQVKLACLSAGLKQIDHHDCSICGHMTHYFVEDEGLLFNPNCNCVRYISPLVPISWQEAADQVNMQTNLEWKIKWAQRFGIDIKLISDVGAL